MYATEDATPAGTLRIADVGQVLDELAQMSHEELVELTWAREEPGRARPPAA